MPKGKSNLVMAGVVALMLAGCSFTDEVLWPGATGEQPAQASGETVVVEPSAAATTQTASVPGGGGSTGTVVGARVAQLQSEHQALQQSVSANGAELQQLRARAAQNAQAYNGGVSQIRTRLQVGTTPGNPELIGQWNQAQGQLDQVNGDIGLMTNLANEANNDVTVAGFLLDAIRSSYSLAGGIDADHRNLEQLENQAAETLQQAAQLQSTVNGELAQQAAYVSSERQNLTTLAHAIDKGHFLGVPVSPRGYSAFAPGGGQQVASVTGRRPLVVIRFDRDNVNYENALFGAINQAMQRLPNAQFDVVAVAPDAGNAATTAAARRHAEQVMRSLTGMGIPANRVTMAATASRSAATPEVHVYVR